MLSSFISLIAHILNIIEIRNVRDHVNHEIWRGGGRRGQLHRVSLWYQLSLFHEGEFYALHSLQEPSKYRRQSLDTSRIQEEMVETESLFLNLASLCLDVIIVVIRGEGSTGKFLLNLRCSVPNKCSRQGHPQKHLNSILPSVIHSAPSKDRAPVWEFRDEYSLISALN